MFKYLSQLLPASQLFTQKKSSKAENGTWGFASERDFV